MKTKITQNLKSIILALILVIGVSYVSASTWVNPPGNPPACPSTIEGCNTPLNIGGTGQIKVGGLTLNTGGAANGLIVSFGNVGLGTLTPSAVLHVKEPLNSAIDIFRVEARHSDINRNGPILAVTADGKVQITDGSQGANKVLTSDANGVASWQAPAGGSGNIVYINPVKIFDLGTTTRGASGSGKSYTVGYGTDLVPTTAKSVILRVFAQANSWRIEVSVGADGLPMQLIAVADGGNNSDDAASDSVVMEIPYSQNRNLTAKWTGVGSANRAMDETGGQYAEVYVIGYRQ